MPVDPNYINTTPTGDVWIRDFDKGIVETMGATVVGSRYYIDVQGIVPPPFPNDWEEATQREQVMPGVPVKFASPDDRVIDFVLPCIVVRRESWEVSLERWPSIHLKYQAPADGAQATQVIRGYNPDGTQNTIDGYDKYEVQYSGFPYDITYLISVLAHGENAESDAQKMLKKVMKAYKPRGSVVYVTDSLGAQRQYDAWAEGPSDLKEVLDIVDRQGGYSLSIKVLGEVDLEDPFEFDPATQLDFSYTSGVS